MNLIERNPKDLAPFWIQNLIAARDFMLSVEPSKVDLSWWRQQVGDSADAPSSQNGPATCGTIACFGGWLPHSPFFRDGLGVKLYGHSGAPMIKTVDDDGDEDELSGCEVADYLFGDSNLFDASGHDERYPDASDGPSRPDHRIVLDRISLRLTELGAE